MKKDAGKRNEWSDSSYENLASVLVGSSYVHLLSTFQSDVIKTRNKIIGKGSLN